MPLFHRWHGSILAFALALSGLSFGQTPATLPTSITAGDLLQVKVLEAPALSPDGAWVVYTVRSIEPKSAAPDEWDYHTHLWLAATDGSQPARQLTRNATQNSAPDWHPDGRRIAFVRGSDTPGEKPQIHVLSLDGGEAVAWTQLETGAGAPQWSPDGRRLMFQSTLSEAQLRAALETARQPSAPPWPSERSHREPLDTANWKNQRSGGKKTDSTATPPLASAQPDGTPAERREWLARNEADGNPRVLTRPTFLAEGDLQPDLSFSTVYVMEAQADATPKAIALGYDALGSARWLPNGREVVVLAPRSIKEHPDRARERSVAIVNVETGALRTVLEGLGESYAAPTPSPDGAWIGVLLQEGGPFSFDPPKVAVVPTQGGRLEALTPLLDRSVQAFKWTPDSDAIVFSYVHEGGFPLGRVGLADRTVQTLTDRADWGIRAFDLDRKQLVQVVTHPGNPSELHVASPRGNASRALTTHNQSWISGRRLAVMEAHRRVNSVGQATQFWTMRPADSVPGQKHPLLLQIHGGPSAMWGPGEDSMWLEFQYFAAQGYALVFGNPRGSGGYGREFQRANHSNWGAGPAADVLGFADFAARLPWVDPTRQVITGGSYGGYLTAWIIAHDQRFKAAVAQRGVYDLVTFFGEGNAWRLVPLYFGGYPWQKPVRDLLERESPLTYVEQIRTPLLIQHGDVDFRTGVIQSQMLYQSLKVLERPVEYTRYPRATHEMSRTGEPRQRLDSLVRYEEFFRRHLDLP
ncbi:MAG TPA: S9 family peptidase [Opitutaceae bacterium]|nr:S9 family peptidase [Opitutaceae bacterium]